jgi:hypothetical protein
MGHECTEAWCFPASVAGSGKLPFDRGDRACDRSGGELRTQMISAVSAVIRDAGSILPGLSH